MSATAVIAALALMQAAAVQTPQDPVPAAPQSAPVQSEDTLSDVVVEGAPATVERLKDFVEEIGGGPRRRLMARWNTPLCIGTANVRRDYAEPFIDHVAQIAVQVGAKVDGPGCRANVLVFFTTDGSTVAKTLVENNPTSFTPDTRGPQLGRAALESFVTKDRPVRWWHLSQDVEALTGNPVQMVTIVTPPPESAEYDVPQIQVARMSRLNSGMRVDLQQALLIVDTSKLGDTSSAALAEYAAMVILTEIDPETQAVGFPSILSLFSDRPTSASLTSWDWNYLRSLYSSATGRPTRQFQEREIATGMQRLITRDVARADAQGE